MQNPVDIPLVGPPNANVDEEHLDQSSAEIYDFIPVIIEGKIHLIKRFGLTPLVNLSPDDNEPVNGLYWYDRGRKVVAVCGNRVNTINDPFGTIGGPGATALLPNGVATFASAEGGSTFVGSNTGVVIANGGPMVWTNLTNAVTLDDAQTPSRVSHVASLDKYVLCNDLDTGQINFSPINNPDGDWVALDSFGAESEPDFTVAIGKAYQELIALGRESVEFFYNDGHTPFSRITGSVQPFGTTAPHSLCMVAGAWMWLDHQKRLVRMNGRQVAPLSNPYERLIQRLVSVEDAVGYSTMVDGRSIYVLNFPSARVTLSYAVGADIWHKWGYWDLGNAEYQRFRAMSYCYATAWGLHLFGDHSNGIVYKATTNSFTDNGNPIRSALRTGHISHGTKFNKRSNYVQVHCKRGVATEDVTDPVLTMRRRVDNRAAWTSERHASLGGSGDHRPYVMFRKNGKYQTCQYEFVHTDNTDCAIMDAKEDITVLLR